MAPAHEVADVQVTVALNGQQFTRSDAALYSSLPSAGVAGGAWYPNGGAAAESLRGLRYRFYAPPQLRGLAPQRGPSAGGTLLRCAARECWATCCTAARARRAACPRRARLGQARAGGGARPRAGGDAGERRRDALRRSRGRRRQLQHACCLVVAPTGTTTPRTAAAAALAASAESLSAGGRGVSCTQRRRRGGTEGELPTRPGLRLVL